MVETHQERHAKKMMPNHMHAGVYAAVLHYLKAVTKSARRPTARPWSRR
jgi:hypothetical protein